MAAKSGGSSVDRRRFLEYTWATLGASLGVALLPSSYAMEAPRLPHNPFTLGVASGDPTPDGIVLWTRLAPVPADPAALGSARIPVGYRIATDPTLRQVVKRGVAVASPELAHSVHVDVRGLKAGRDYFYRFHVRGEESGIGHFRTAPAHDQLADELRFACATCQDWPSGYYTAYRDMVKQDLDLVLHLGDYTYEYAIGAATRRDEPTPSGFGEEARDLRTYRLRHTLYKLDPDLQAAHAAFPFATIWDDHEVQSDYSGVAPEHARPSAAFSARRAAAYQAYYEHMPIRSNVSALPELRIYRRLRYGKLAEFTLLDGRQYRSNNPCGDGEEVRCAEALKGDYTFLGRGQERWLERSFARSRARWKRRSEPRLHHGRLALHVRQRSQARFQAPAVRHDRNGVRDTRAHERWRRRAVRGLLWAHAAVQPTHQVLRG
jgi:alkaline phosphatase D